jgi:hypothetical protein
MDKEALFAEFKRDVFDPADPDDDELDWFSLGFGWLLAKGCTAEQAYELASEGRYKRGLM